MDTEEQKKAGNTHRSRDVSFVFKSCIWGDKKRELDKKGHTVTVFDNKIKLQYH